VWHSLQSGGPVYTLLYLKKNALLFPKRLADIYKSARSNISRGLKSYSAERHSVLVPYAKTPVTTCCRKSYILAVNVSCLLFHLTGPRCIQGNVTGSTGFDDKIRELALGESGSSVFI
jgi:hypothetical protein